MVLSLLSCEMNLQPLEHSLYVVAKGLFPIVYRCGQKVPNQVATPPTRLIDNG